MARFRESADQGSDNRQSQYSKLLHVYCVHTCIHTPPSNVDTHTRTHTHTHTHTHTVEELQTEFFRDIEVATIVDPERLRKSTSDSSSLTSRDS